MVVCETRSPADTSVGLLHPALPAMLMGSRVAGGAGRPAAGRGGVYSFQPRAVDAAASSPSSGGSGSSQANSSSSAGSKSTLSGQSSASGPSFPFQLPKPSFKGAAMSIGAGGGAYAGGAAPAKAVSLWPFSKSSEVVPKEGGRKRLLVMMSNTGGGHKASAEALRDVFHELYGDEFELFIADMWTDHTPWPFNRWPESYAFMVKYPVIWKVSYEITQPKVMHVPYLGFVGIFMRSGIHKAYDKYQPDLVISVHPLMQHIPLAVLKHRIRTGRTKPINFATVVTDYTTCHNAWFHKDCTRIFVPTDYCANLAKRHGLKPEQILLTGLPIRPAFSRPLHDRKTMRKKLGMDPNKPAVLIVGGGEGVGALEAIVEEMDKQMGQTAQAVVICGRNKAMLARMKAKNHPGGMFVTPLGFVDNVHEWMNACDACITKAGPGTIAEALISGLPILINGHIPGQEEGNIPYVVENGVGAHETNPAKIAVIIRNWFSDDPKHQEAFAEMARKSKALGKPQGVYDIVKGLAQLGREIDYKYGPAAAASKSVKVAAQRQAATARVAAAASITSSSTASITSSAGPLASHLSQAMSGMINHFKAMQVQPLFASAPPAV